MLESKKTNKKISVIVASYKPQSYVWKCIDSLASQTLDADLYEVIIVLNGPKEPYFNEIADYVAKKGIQNLNLIYTDKRGVSEARNIGLEISVGNYLVFTDDDDYISENYLESLLGNAEKKTIVLSDNEFFEDMTNKVLSNPRSDSFKPNYETTNILKFRKFYRVAWGKLIPRNLIGNIKFDTNIQPGEDTLFIMEVLSKVQKIRTIQEGSFYHRRIRENSLIGPKTRLIDHWKLHSYQIVRHLMILPRKSSLPHKIIVTASMLGILRYFLKRSFSLILNKTS